MGERYDRDLKDIFTVQDEPTRRIVATMIPELERAERERTSKYAPTNIDAWMCYLQGISFLNKLSDEALPKAKAMLEAAIKLDPDYTQAWAQLAMVHFRQLRYGTPDDPPKIIRRMMEVAPTSARLDDGESLAHLALAHAHNVVGDEETAIHEARRAYELNP